MRFAVLYWLVRRRLALLPTCARDYPLLIALRQIVGDTSHRTVVLALIARLFTGWEDYCGGRLMSVFGNLRQQLALDIFEVE